MKVYISKSEDNTFKIASNFAQKLKKGDIIGLIGDLGAGKTIFVKGVAKYFGINPDEVVSPTFTIINEYEGKDFFIYHFDLYRIDTKADLENLGYEEYFTNKGIVLIEWPEKFEEILNSTNYIVKIEYLNENLRKVIIK